MVLLLLLYTTLLQELCNAIGPVDNVTMTAPGVTEVTFRYKDDALEAYKKYNQRNLDGMLNIVYDGMLVMIIIL